MTGARKRRVLALGVAAAITGLALTVSTAIPLAAFGTLGRRPPPALVVTHIGAASLLLLGLALKVAAFGRALLTRAARFWASLIAVLAIALAAYASVTGVLRLFDARWSNQHLAAGFWTTVLAAAHVAHRRTRARRLLMAQGGAQSAQRSGVVVR